MSEISNLSLSGLTQLMQERGAKVILAKELAGNDNSKNQVYFGGNFEILNILPFGELTEDITFKGRKSLKAPIDFYWLTSEWSLAHAPDAQLILYPQYPEIRFSGFLRGAQGGPNALMTIRQEGRFLFLGIVDETKVIGWVCSHDSKIAAEARSLSNAKQTEVFKHIPLATQTDARAHLLERLADIHLGGWTPPVILEQSGMLRPCLGSNCGGYTLEAHLGIVPNGRSEPDFMGWEVKAHAVSNFQRYTAGPLTLMTPEPTGGVYKQEGVETFLRRYGYADMRGREDRINFGGIHKIGLRHPRTKLALQFFGYDVVRQKITDPGGGFALVDDAGHQAAVWHFSGLIDHWKRKHSKAVYVPYMARQHRGDDAAAVVTQYSYGGRVRLGEGTDFLRFLLAMAQQKIYYDPGIKLEHASTSAPRIKRRSQFRIGSSNLATLYEGMISQELA